MADSFTDELRVRVHPDFSAAYSGMSVPVIDGCLNFRFSLDRKSTRMGATTFDHRWMRINSIYGQRNTSGSNREAIADSFWASCLEDGYGASEPDVQTIYLLSKLLPFVRSSGGRHAFADARLPRWKPADVAELDGLISAGREKLVTMHEFQSQVGELLGPPSYTAAAKILYLEWEQELFSEPCRLLIQQPQEAFAAVYSIWDRWIRTISRHSGNVDKKQILDVLSYEARAAIHRCYSHVWLNLLKKWAKLGEMSDEAINFHRVWHLELIDNQNSALPNQHLFHGHILGLHPAGSNFIQTTTGTDLIGDYVTKVPGSTEFDQAFQRLLNGLLVAIYDFARRRADYSSMRGQPAPLPGEELDRARAERNQRGRRVSRRGPNDE